MGWVRVGEQGACHNPAKRLWSLLRGSLGVRFFPFLAGRGPSSEGRGTNLSATSLPERTSRRLGSEAAVAAELKVCLLRAKSGHWSLGISVLFREYDFPIILHVDNGPILFTRQSQCPVQMPNLRIPIVSPFSLCIGVMQ